MTEPVSTELVNTTFMPESIRNASRIPLFILEPIFLVSQTRALTWLSDDWIWNMDWCQSTTIHMNLPFDFQTFLYLCISVFPPFLNVYGVEFRIYNFLLRVSIATGIMKLMAIILIFRGCDGEHFKITIIQLVLVIKWIEFQIVYQGDEFYEGWINI